MKIITKILLIHLFIVFGVAISFSDNSLENQMLWNHLERRSKVWLEQHIKQNGGAIDPGEWKIPIEKAFINLASASSHQPFRLTYAVIKNESFNAGAFPAGQFVIHSGTLTVMDKWARK